MPKYRPFLTPELRGEQEISYMRCRALRSHMWDVIGAGDRIPEFGSMLCLRCESCGTLRYDRFSRITGERLGPPNYVWPDGYRDAEGHDTNWWRANWTTALTVLDPKLIANADEVSAKRRRRAS